MSAVFDPFDTFSCFSLRKGAQELKQVRATVQWRPGGETLQRWIHVFLSFDFNFYLHVFAVYSLLYMHAVLSVNKINVGLFVQSYCTHTSYSNLSPLLCALPYAVPWPPTHPLPLLQALEGLVVQIFYNTYVSEPDKAESLVKVIHSIVLWMCYPVHSLIQVLNIWRSQEYFTDKILEVNIRLN